MRTPTWLKSTGLTLAACLAAGCGPNVTVTGKVMRGGQPLSATPGMHLNVAFHPVAEGGAAKKSVGPDLFAADVEPGGAFRVPGIEGDGIPPGKYRVSVTLRAPKDRSKKRDKAKARSYDPDKDYLNDAFGSDNSPIVREVTSSSEMVIDLDKPTG